MTPSAVLPHGDDVENHRAGEEKSNAHKYTEDDAIETLKLFTLFSNLSSQPVSPASQ